MEALVAWRADNLDALHADETVTIPADRLHTHIWYREIAHVPWLVDKSVDWLTVTADDVVTPTAAPRPAAGS
jgi:hypothetical protein